MKKARLGVLLAVVLTPGFSSLVAAQESGDALGENQEGEETAPDESPAEEPAPEQDVVEQDDAPPAEEVELQPPPPDATVAEEPAAEETGESLLTEEEAEVVEEEAAEALPWALPLYWDNELTVRSFNRAGQLTYNPTYTMSFSVRPQWTFEDIETWIRLRQDVSVELTDTDTYNTNRELVWSDTIIDLVYDGIPEFAGIDSWIGVRTHLPTSKASRAANRILSGGIRAGMLRTFDVAAGLDVGVSGSFVHYFARTNVPTTEETDPFAEGYDAQRTCTIVDSGGSADRVCGTLGGMSSVRDASTLALEAAIRPIEALEIGSTFTWWWQRGHDLGTAYFETLDGGIVPVGDMSATHRRLLTWFTFDVSYDVTDYLGLSLSYSTLSSWIDEDGRFQNPIFNDSTSIILGATFSVDSLYQHVSSTETATAESGEGSSETASVATTGADW